MAPALLIFAALAAITWYDYGFFRERYLVVHILAESFSILVAVGVFVLAWHSRRRLDHSYLLVIGTAYLFVGVLDFTHLLAYKDMGVFPASMETKLATQLWVSARYLESLSLAVAGLLLSRRLQPYLLFLAYVVVTVLVLGSIFAWEIFPACYQEGQGLTPFKKFSEYLISLILLASAVLLIGRRRWFDPEVLVLMVLSMGVTIVSEMAFTLYKDPYGPANFWGHVLKIASFYLIYRAVIYRALDKPHEILFRQLTQSRQAIQKARDELEQRVEERTAELVSANEQLREQIAERIEAEQTLALERLRFVSLLHKLPGYVALFDGHCGIRFANHKFLELFGEPADRPCYEVLRRKDRRCADCPLGANPPGAEPKEWEWTDFCSRTYHTWSYPFVDVDHSGVTLMLGIEITTQKKLERDVLEISEQERLRIGQDLHDSVGQNLTGVAFLANVLAERLSPGNTEGARDAARIEELVNQTIAQTRAIAKGLCPVATTSDGLVDALKELAAQATQVHGVRCTFERKGRFQLAPGAATHLYRIAQEAVNNATKHAKASHVRIGLVARESSVDVTVEDDGVGLRLELRRSAGMGLRVMRYRADVIGASIEFDSEPGRGTTVKCSLETSETSP